MPCGGGMLCGWPPRDSLFSVAYRSRIGSGNVPEWLKEQDWMRQDFSFSLDGTMKKYFREWGINGHQSMFVPSIAKEKALKIK